MPNTAITPGQPLTPEQVNNFRSQLNINPTQTAQVATGNDPWSKFDSIVGNGTQNETSQTNPRDSSFSDIPEQAESGINEAEQGYQEALPGAGKNLGTLIEGVGKELGGAANVITSPLAPAFKPISDIMSDIGNRIADIPAVQNFADTPAGEAASHVAGTVGDFANAAGTIAGGGEAIESMPSMSDVHEGISNIVNAVNPTEKVRSTLTNLQGKMGEGNIDPRVQTSAERMQDPLTTYNQFADEAQAAKTDVKADPPIATVGERIGDNYDKVVQMRREVGQQMADELDKVKDIPVDISESLAKLAPQIEAGEGKMTTFDKQLVNEYQLEAKSLGANPTAKDLDDFLSRVPNQLDVAKADKNITHVTNAERIIKGNLADIRNSLISQPGMADYAKARGAYADLSNFLDEGSKYLGAKTQSGDFARDASVAKSSAESILNGGKKDWLVKLEGLTGYPALDEATLAIQAMKDVGDNRGLSLFKTLAGGDSPGGITGKIINWGFNKGRRMLVGDAPQQTRAFLKRIKP